MNTDFFRHSSGLTITGLAAGALKINGGAEFAEAMASVNGGVTLNAMGRVKGAITLTALSPSRSGMSHKADAGGTSTLIGLSIGPDAIGLDPVSGGLTSLRGSRA